MLIDFKKPQWLILIVNTIRLPFIILSLTILIFLAYAITANLLQLSANYPLANKIINNIFKLLIFTGLIWLSVNVINTLYKLIYARFSKNRLYFALPVINNGIKLIVILILINLFVPYFDLKPENLAIFEKITVLFIIISITWLIILLINGLEKLAITHYQTKIYENLESRRVYTQIHLLKRLLISIIGILCVAFCLMIFDRAREFGTSILASAGLIAAIAGFAAQRTLASQFAGLHIALTQPIKINDAVLIENEFGNIEEITLTYVIIKLWDLRRLVVPINYFIEKPFQNWSRISSNLLGTVFLYIDYSFPIDIIKIEFIKILNQSTLWDKKANTVQVTDIKGNIIELRFLVSAADAGKLWDLRCEVREKLINFMRNNYPDRLPKSHIEVK